MLTVSLILGALYAGLVGWFLVGWFRLPTFNPVQAQPPGRDNKTFFSVIIPARNEQATIGNCLQSLKKQDLGANHFEVIVVDDHSTDNTKNVIADWQNRNGDFPLYLINAPEPQDSQYVAFKKLAIQAGIEHASGNWVVTTDADCWVCESWLSTLARFIQDKDPYLIAGPVQFQPKGHFFEKMQGLEFMSLIGIGAASIRNQAPNMCNGANLAYQKAIFHEVGGFSGYDHLASGDDEFLMRKVFQRYPKHVTFLKSPKAIVKTQPVQSLKAFLQQRKRWVSKGSVYTEWTTNFVTYFVFFYHLAIIAALVSLPFSPYLGVVYLILMGFKVGIEFLFLLPLSQFFEVRHWLLYYIPAAIFYPFYVVFIAIYANTGTYSWKEREVQ